mgnify:CR=1 FL=1
MNPRTMRILLQPHTAGPVSTRSTFGRMRQHVAAIAVIDCDAGLLSNTVSFRGLLHARRRQAEAAHFASFVRSRSMSARVRARNCISRS